MVDVAIVFPPSPTATHKLLAYAILRPELGEPLKTVAPRPVQLIPSVEVAMVFPPEPTATHKPAPESSWPYATPRPFEVKTVAPRPVQVIPSTDVAMVFPPEPTATHKLLAYTTPFP